MKKAIISHLALLIILCSYAAALGVAPSRTETFYQSLQEAEISFNIINNENKEMDVSLYPKGELAQYITLEHENIHLGKDEFQKAVKYKVNFPVRLEPGQKTAEVWAVETGDDDQGILTAKIGVMHNLVVNVPYPEEYLLGILYISEAKPGEKVTFTIVLSNVGSKPLENIKGQIILSGPDGKGLGKIDTGQVSIDKGEKSKITAEWIADVNPGTYKVQAIVEYDKKIFILDKTMDIGEPLVEISDVRAGQFRLGTIAKFDIMLRNLWNQKIPDAFGITEIRDMDGELVTSYKTAAVDIPGEGAKEIISYWDTAGISPGDFQLGVKANYLGRSREKSFSLKVEENKITVNSLTGEVISPGSGNKKSGFILLAIFIGILGLGAVSALMLNKRRQMKPQTVKSSMKPEATPEGARGKLHDYFKYNMSQGISIMALKKKAIEKGYSEQFVDGIILDIEEENKKGI